MRAKLVAVVFSAVALACTAVASASPPDDVDRERLKKALANLPSIQLRWGIEIGPTGPLAWSEASETQPDVASLRARLKGDDSDADAHLELAAAHRRLGDAESSRESLRMATAILRRQASAHPDAPHTLASLALALAAAGKDAETDETLRLAQSIAHPGREVWSVSGSVLTTRAIGELAGGRFADLFDGYSWLASGAALAPGASPLPKNCASRLAEAAVAYDKAIDAALKDGDPADVFTAYIDRSEFRCHRLLVPRESGAGAADVADWTAAVGDVVKAAEAAPPEPRTITLVVALALSSSPSNFRPGPRKMTELSEPARAVAEDGLARLAKLAESPDDTIAARALEGIGAIGYFCEDDPAKMESVLRRAIAKDPSLRQPWALLLGICRKAQRWDDMKKLLGEWLKSGETAEKRVLLAKVEERRGDGTAAEKQWRVAHALDPKGYTTNLGLGDAILRNSKPGDDLKPPEDALRAAGEAYRPESRTASRRWIEITLSEAVLRGLTGDLDGAAEDARRVLKADPGNQAAQEILAAIGR